MRRPEEILTKLNAERLAFFNIIISRIEKDLENRFSGSRVVVIVPYSKNKLNEILSNLQTQLRGFGWTIKLGKESETMRDTYTELLIDPIDRANY